MTRELHQQSWMNISFIPTFGWF